MKLALVTGGAGFIGSHLTHSLIQRGGAETSLHDALKETVAWMKDEKPDVMASRPS